MKPPKSGRLFQESLRRRPFWMLVGCQLVNQTTWEQARPALRWLMKHYYADGLAAAQPEHLHETLKPLGLWRRRSKILIEFARHWTATDHGRNRSRSWQHIMMLPGCGKYAADSWRIFIQGHKSARPKDGKLRWYLRRQRTSRR